MFEREQWQHVENLIHCLVHCSDKIENHPLLFERGHWQYLENQIHCLVKQQWQHMEIHPVLCIHWCLKESSDNMWKPHILFSAQQWKHMEHLPLFIKCAVKTRRKPNPLLFERGSDKMWKTTHTASWNSRTTYENNHPLPIKCDVTTHGKNIHCSLKENSGNLWKITSTV